MNEMNTWVTGGAPPATGAPLLLADAGTGYAKDPEGNTLGGVPARQPSTSRSRRTAASRPRRTSSCSLFGATTPLSPTQLLSLYPTHDDYVTKVTAATATAQQAGFILAADAPLIVQEAQAAPIHPQ